MFDRKKIIPQPKAKGLKKQAPAKKKVGGEAKVVAKYPPVNDILDNPEEAKKVARDLDDYLATVTLDILFLELLEIVFNVRKCNFSKFI